MVIKKSPNPRSKMELQMAGKRDPTKQLKIKYL